LICSGGCRAKAGRSGHG